MTYSDNFKKLEAILYDESGSPRKEIPKDFLEEISDQAIALYLVDCRSISTTSAARTISTSLLQRLLG